MTTECEWRSLFYGEGPEDMDWVLVADDRFKTPKKARFKLDSANTLSYDDGRTFDYDYPWEHAYAWMPLPDMPTREMMERLYGQDGDMA